MNSFALASVLLFCVSVSMGQEICPEIPPEADFGECAMPLGIALIGGECLSISGCSTVADDDVDYADYFYFNLDSCLTCSGCINPAQIDSTQGCFEVFLPVCGCDGETYPNDCYAYYYGGLTSWVAGECGEPDPCPELAEGLDFGACDMVLGVALVNGTCTTLSGCSTTAMNGVDYSAYFYETPEECILCQQSGIDNLGQQKFSLIALHNELFIKSDKPTLEITLYDLGGRQVWSSGRLDVTEGSIPRPNLALGSYIYRAQFRDSYAGGKLLLK